MEVRFQAKLAPCDSRRIKGFVFFINKREGAANDPTNKYEIRSTITNTNGSPTTRHREGIVFPVISIALTRYALQSPPTIIYIYRSRDVLQAPASNAYVK